jgi:hypothetical protein
MERQLGPVGPSSGRSFGLWQAPAEVNGNTRAPIPTSGKTITIPHCFIARRDDLKNPSSHSHFFCNNQTQTRGDEKIMVLRNLQKGGIRSSFMMDATD